MNFFMFKDNAEYVWEYKMITGGMIQNGYPL